MIIFIVLFNYFFVFTCIFSFLYVILKYIDNEENKGNRSWSYMRQFFWGKSVEIEATNVQQLKSDNLNGKRVVFMVVGNLTNMSLISTFGLNGAQICKNMDLVYMLPKILFYIPILRDFLLWTGAIAWKQENIMNSIHKGKIVAYAPENMRDLLQEVDIVSPPANEEFQFAMDNKLWIIPVLIRNETSRYMIFRNRIQSYFYSSTRLNYPFPHIFFLKIFAQEPPKRVKVFIGNPIDSSQYQEPAKLKSVFLGEFGNYVGQGGDNEELMLIDDL